MGESTITPSVGVCKLWEAMSSKKSGSCGVLEMPGGADVIIKKIVKDARETLNIKGDSDSEVLLKLQEILNEASSSSSARSAIIGIATVLGDVGSFGRVLASRAPESDEQIKSISLMDVAREVSRTALLHMAKGGMDRCIQKLQNWLSDIAIETGFFPKKIRDAIEATKKSIAQASLDLSLENTTALTVGSNVLVLRNLVSEYIKTPELIPEQRATGRKLISFLESFLNLLSSIIPSFDEALRVDAEATEAFGRTEEILASSTTKSLNEHVKCLKNLEQRVSPLVENGLLPTSILDRIHIDLACCLQQIGSVPEKKIRKLVATVQSSLPRDLTDTIDRENLLQARKITHSHSVFTQYDDAMALLERLCVNPNKKELTEKEASMIKELFEYATANAELNGRLYPKENKTPVEELLASFSYVTLRTIEIKDTLDRVTKVLRETGIQNLIAVCNVVDVFPTTLISASAADDAAFDAYIEEAGEKIQALMKKKAVKAEKAEFRNEILSAWEAVQKCSSEQMDGKRVSEVRADAVQSLIGTLGKVSGGLAKPVLTISNTYKKSLDASISAPATADYIVYIGEADLPIRTLLENENVPKELQAKLHQSWEALKESPLEPVWQKRLSGEHYHAVSEMIKVLNEIKTRVASKKAANDIKTYVDDSLKGLLEYQKALDAVATQRKKLVQAETPIQSQDIHLIGQFSQIAALFDFVPPDARKTLSLSAVSLEEHAKTAQDLIHSLGLCMQILPSYRGGDILLSDERLLKKHRGEEKNIYAGKSLASSPGLFFRLVKDAMSKGIFAIQPFFTGAFTHASCIVPNGSPCTMSDAEIPTQFSVGSVQIEDSLTRIAYRPQFDKILTSGGAEQLQEKGVANYAEKLASIYSARLASFIETNKKALSVIENNDIKAAEAFILSRSPVSRALSRQLMTQHIKVDKERPSEPIEGPGLKAFSTQMFCSEFVAALTTTVLRQVESELRDTYGLTGPIFETEVFITPEELPTMHPNKLQERLEKYFVEADPPEVAQLLFGAVKRDVPKAIEKGL